MAAGTRSSVGTISTSSRRPRRSPPTFRERSGSPSPSTGPPSSDSPLPWPDDSIVVCSFGDASANHSTALGAINTAVNSAYQGVPTPILFVCEDNGIGISTKTAPGWIASTFGARAGLNYFAADGSDLPAVCAAAAARHGGSASTGAPPSCT